MQMLKNRNCAVFDNGITNIVKGAVKMFTTVETWLFFGMIVLAIITGICIWFYEDRFIAAERVIVAFFKSALRHERKVRE